MRRLALAGVGGVYLLVTLTFSLLTPAGENNDELSHVQYIEYVVQHHDFPRISLSNGHESHQPPLYYLVGAAFQEMLGIKPFNFQLAVNTVPGRLSLVHNYSSTQRQEARSVHDLRLLSVLFGLGTVLLSYAIAKVVVRRTDVALATALFVALLPKEDVVSAAVTNDSLVIVLSSLALLLGLLWWRSLSRRRGGRYAHTWLAALLGLVLGMAVLTKFTAVPLTVLFVALALVLVPVGRRTFRTWAWLDVVLMVVGCLIVSGWWLLRNRHLYGQFLATRASDAYLEKWLPGLIHQRSLFDAVVHFVPPLLMQSAWYDGDFNQLVLPHWMNLVLWVLAALAAVGFVALLWRSPGGRHGAAPSLAVSWPDAAFLGAAIVGGIVALLSIATAASQAEGRITFVGLSAFAVVMVGGLQPIGERLVRVGSEQAAVRRRFALLAVWPALFLLVDVYVLVHFVLPHRGL